MIAYQLTGPQGVTFPPQLACHAKVLLAIFMPFVQASIGEKLQPKRRHRRNGSTELLSSDTVKERPSAAGLMRCYPCPYNWPGGHKTGAQASCA